MYRGRMLLYNSGISGNCYKVRQLLAHLGIDYEKQEVDVIDRTVDRTPLLGELNPALRLPTIVLDDGRPLAESNAILCYFAEGSDYLPADRYERAQVLQWLFFEQYSHEPYVAIARFVKSYMAGDPPEQYLASKQRGGHKALVMMEHHLATREFLVADRYSIADIALYAYTHVAPEGGIELDGYPAVQAWLARVAAQPGHVLISD